MDAAGTPSMTDSWNLGRFVAAQGPVYADALEELRDGCKVSHWMWFVFPQIDGLGRSETARQFAISGLDEARAYLDHPQLGPRLLECCVSLLSINDRSAEDIFGDIDALKLRSSMTLFSRASDLPVFRSVLEKYFAGEPDDATLAILKQHSDT